LHVDEWEDMTMCDNKPKAHTFTKNARPQFNLPLDAEPIDYFVLFFNDELLNNIFIEPSGNARHKIVEIQLSLRSIWIRWCDVSVPKVKSFLGLIINMA
jgi:hypothetical protein